jgi:hypothetical protein
MWMPRGEGDGHWPKTPPKKKLWKAMNLKPKLNFLGKVSVVGTLFWGGLHHANQNLNWCNMSFINFYEEITCIIISEMFYNMHVLKLEVS